MRHHVRFNWLPSECLAFRHLQDPAKDNIRFAEFADGSSWEEVRAQNSWLSSSNLVAKPDQLIKRRGKLGLLKVACSML